MNVLHVVGGLSTGGIEKWLLNLAEVTTSPVNLHIYSTNSTRVELVDDFIKKFSSVDIVSKDDLLSRCKQLIEIIDQREIDIVQSHCDLASGYYAFVVKTLRPNVKFITHCHSDRRFISKSSIKKIVYTKMMQWCIKKYSDSNIAVSSFAKESLFPKAKSTVIYCGIPKLNVNKINDHILEGFVAKGKHLIFHIARFNEAKNHEFILELAERVDDRFIFVFLGDGEKFNKIKILAEKSDINNIVFKGSVDNVGDYLYSYASLLILPSLWEGLPLTVIESQTLGIQTLISDNVTKECNIGLAKFIKLDINDWIEEFINFKIEKQDKCKLGDFDININNGHLIELYQEIKN